jgi:CHAT domain-containing protein/tetratricopeptide (TPR) repeat protein
VNLDDKHLSDEQIDWLIAHERGDTERSESRELIENVRGHLTGCEACQRMVQMHYKLEKYLRTLRTSNTGVPGKDCPSNESLREAVAGIKSVQESEKLLDHTAHCDYCASLLREAIDELATESTPEEVSLLADLPSAQPNFQRKLAKKLASAPLQTGAGQTRVLPLALPTPKLSYLQLHRSVYAAAAVFMVALMGFWFVVRLRRPSADQLIARAYSDQRSLELRLADATPAPIRQQRGTERSSFSKPAALLEAELLIKLQLQKTPNDAKWLAARGRSELLEWQYEDAIRSFERALETNADSPDLLRDLATAHFQRAEAEHLPNDYGSAIELLSEALVKRPNDPVCLFNRAIIYERMFLYDSAMKDWETYLRMDPSGSWSTEARERLEEVKKKLQKHDQSQELPIEDPVAAAIYFSERLNSNSATHDEANSVDEQYLDLATAKWLSTLAEDLRHGKSLQQSPTGQALQLFSTLWETSHGDPWLSDLLKSANLPWFPDAAEALARAVTAASEGDPSLARRRAQLAANLFGRVPNRAGTLRAKLEGIYALQRSLEGEKCLKSARNLGVELEGLSYHWLRAKLLLEESACAGSTAQIEDAEHDVQRSEEIATQRKFGGLYLRGLSFASDFASDKGDRNLAWKRAQLGLERFWSGSFAPIRGYGLCASLGYLAEDSEQGWTAIAFWSEALPLIERTANRSTEGLARYRLATDEIAVGNKYEANRELKRVSQIFTSLPNDSTSLNYRVASEVSLASVDLSLGERASAKALLNEISPFVSNVVQYQTALQYYQTMAEEHILDGEWNAAEESLRSAVAIGRRGLIALTSDADRLNWDQQTSAAYRSLVRLLISEPGREEEGLRVWELYRSLPSQTSRVTSLPHESTLAELGSRPPKPSEADVDALLPLLKKVTFLTYTQLDDGIALWAYDDRGIRFRRVSVPIEEISAVSKRFVRLCSDPSSDINLLRMDAKKLYEWLIYPVQPLLSPERTIWIEPDGVLSLIPFQVLIDEEGSPLLREFPVAYRTAATSEHWAREPLVATNDQVVVATTLLLPHQSSRALPPLPDAVKEAEAIAALFPNHRLLLDEDSKPEVIRAELRRAAVFHYAGHYVPMEDINRSPLGSILQTGSTRNTKSEVASSFLLSRCKLVVLSACSTGAGARLGLFDPNGLVRPLLRAGARRVIASRWSVDSTVTAELMGNLYSALLSGQTSADALRAASRKLAEDPKYAHPYYWAGFGVFAKD